MLYNHIKTAFRYLKNHKFYAVSNFGGLTLGFFCFLLLNFYIRSEQNYDRDHGHVFRMLETIQDDNGTVRVSAQSGPQVTLTAKSRFPEVEAATQIFPFGRITVGNDPASLSYEPISVIDRDFFEVF